MSDRSGRDITKRTKELFFNKVVDKVSDRNAYAVLTDMLNDDSCINWGKLYRIIADNFPEVDQSDYSKELTLEDVGEILALKTFNHWWYEGSFNDFEEWLEQNNNNPYVYHYEPLDLYSFQAVVNILSQYFYDYEYGEDTKDCDDLALYVTREVFEEE